VIGALVPLSGEEEGADDCSPDEVDRESFIRLHPILGAKQLASVG